MAKHREYDREEDGHEEHIDASPGWTADDDEDTDDESLESQGMHETTLSEEADKTERLNDEDDETADEQADAVAKQKEYAERKAVENVRKAHAKEHASAAERAAQGALEREYQPQSKRLLKWAVIPARTPPQDDPYDSEVDPDYIISDKEVQKRAEQVKRQEKSIADLQKSRRTAQFIQKGLGNMSNPRIAALPEHERADKQREIKDKIALLEGHIKEGNSQLVRLQEKHEWAKKRNAQVTGRVGAESPLPPTPPSSRNQSRDYPTGKSGPAPVSESLYSATKEKRQTEAQRYYEETEKLKEGGMTDDEAINEVAKKYKTKTDVIRTGIYKYRTTASRLSPSQLERLSKKLPLSQEDLKNVVIRHAELTRKKNSRELNESEYKEWKRLGRITDSYRNVEVPNEEGKSSEKAVRQQTREQLEKQYPVEFVPEQEDISATIASYGHEDPDLGPIKGWKATTKFQKEQLKRKYKALATGEASMGYGPGLSPGVAPEKAKYTIGPNQDWLIKSHDWAPSNPKEAGAGKDVFTVRVDPNRAGKNKEYNAETGEFTESGFTVGDTIKDLGVGLGQTNVEPTNELGVYKITTKTGDHLNPDQVKALKVALHVYHGMDEKDFKAEGTIPYQRVHKRVPVGYSKLPKDFDENEDIRSRRQIYKNRFGARLGERHPVTGELLSGERNSIGMKIGPKKSQYALQTHFNEDTDAIGWGTSWRPGNKEVSSAVFALPKAKQEREMAVAWEQWDQTGDEQPLHDFMNKYHPDADEAEVDDRLKHIKEVTGAAAAASYYSYKKKALPRSVNYVFKQGERVPFLKPHLQKWETAEYPNALMKDIHFGVRVPLSQKIEKAKIRVARPFSALRINPDTGKWETDPTVLGISNESKLNIPSWRYRKRPISLQKYGPRQLERELETIKTLKGTRQQVENVLSGKEETSAFQRWIKFRQGKGMLWDVYQRSNETWKKNLDLLGATIDRDLKRGQYQVKSETFDLAAHPTLKLHLLNLSNSVHNLQLEARMNPNLHQREHLEELIEDYAKAHPSKLPERVGRIGKATVWGTAATGAGILAVDRYQVYKKNRGEEITHPIINSVIPERITVPKVSARVTKKLTIPDNQFTDAFDLQGQKIPVAGRISVSREEKVRLRHHRDISGDPYKKSLPLLGGLGVRAPAPVEGSIKEGVISDTPRSELGPTKNIYALGKKVPIDISVGKKERWDNKSHKLRARNNRYKLDQEDREKLLVMGTIPYEGTVTPEGERIQQFYYTDPKLQEMFEDKKEIDRVHKKHQDWSGNMGTITKDKDFAGTGATVEQEISRNRYARRAKDPNDRGSGGNTLH